MKRKPSVLIIFLTVFIDLIGFGIVVPLVPIYSRHYGAGGWMIGAIIASFSAMQFVFSPIWGRLSDRHGRRPILLVSTAGAALSYVLFAFGSGLDNPGAALGVLLLSRVFAGITAGKSDKEILDPFAAKYGATVLAAPTTEGFNLVAWIAPFAVFAAALLGTVLLVRRWANISVGKQQSANQLSDPATDALKEKIRRETGSDGGY